MIEEGLRLLSRIVLDKRLSRNQCLINDENILLEISWRIMEENVRNKTSSKEYASAVNFKMRQGCLRQKTKYRGSQFKGLLFLAQDLLPPWKYPITTPSSRSVGFRQSEYLQQHAAPIGNTDPRKVSSITVMEPDLCFNTSSFVSL